MSFLTLLICFPTDWIEIATQPKHFLLSFAQLHPSVLVISKPSSYKVQYYIPNIGYVHFFHVQGKCQGFNARVFDLQLKR